MSGLDCKSAEKGQKFSLEETLFVVKIFLYFHSVQYPFACSFLHLKTQSVQFVFSPFSVSVIHCAPRIPAFALQPSGPDMFKWCG